MKPIPFKLQVQNNLLAIISLMVAITALSYNTWRNEASEKNRNIRLAAFEVLKNLGELQIVINYAHYQPGNSMGNPFLGWGHITLASDLGQLLPAPVPSKVDKLTATWGANWQKLKTDDAATDAVSQDVDSAREAVLVVLRHLK
jgi:hypothetical protein